MRRNVVCSFGCTILLSIEIYSQTCIQWSLLGQRKNDQIRQVTPYLRFVHLDHQFQSEMIYVLLLPTVNLF